MTYICRRCGAEVQEKFVGSIKVFGHLRNPKQFHHPVVAKVAAETDTERKEAWGR